MTKNKPSKETMEEGDYSGMHDEMEETGEGTMMDEDAENEDEEAGDSVYDMFCDLSDSERARVYGKIQQHMSVKKKAPMSRDDEREFQPMEKGV